MADNYGSDYLTIVDEDGTEFELEVLRLYLNGFSYKIIGEKLGKTEKSVGNALSRVRKKLRAEIGPED
jgi:RNA polymerase sporulation-specific sigma factor